LRASNKALIKVRLLESSAQTLRVLYDGFMRSCVAPRKIIVPNKLNEMRCQAEIATGNA
jgi:hypothetical protein